MVAEMPKYIKAQSNYYILFFIIMSFIKIELNNSTELISPYYSKCFEIVYIILLALGTIGNSIVIFCYSSKQNAKRHIFFVAFIQQSLVHVLLLYMNSFDFIQMSTIVQLIINSDLACSIYNLIFRSLLLIDSW